MNVNSPTLDAASLPEVFVPSALRIGEQQNGPSKGGQNARHARTKQASGSTPAGLTPRPHQVSPGTQPRVSRPVAIALSLLSVRRNRFSHPCSPSSTRLSSSKMESPRIILSTFKSKHRKTIEESAPHRNQTGKYLHLNFLNQVEHTKTPKRAPVGQAFQPDKGPFLTRTLHRPHLKFEVSNLSPPHAPLAFAIPKAYLPHSTDPTIQSIESIVPFRVILSTRTLFAFGGMLRFLTEQATLARLYKLGLLEILLAQAVQETTAMRTPTTLRSPVEETKAAEFENLKRKIHGKLVDKLDLSKVGELAGDVLRREIRLVVEHLCDTEDTLLNRSERDRLVDEVLDETFGLGPLEMLLKDPTISDILINGPKNIYVERRGKMEKTTVQFRDNNHLLQIIDRIVSKVGRRVDEVCPMVDARLQDGSRVNAIIPPLALDGAAVSIRRFGSNPLKLEDLLNYKAFTPEMVMLLEGAMKARLNIVISGGTGSGKTTLLNTLSSFIPNTDRIVTIEDAAELQLQQDHVVRLETRPANIEGKGAITATDLVRNALRMRPERIIIGECRGPETLDMLQAMNTGHDGSLTTLHANTPRDAIARMETMITMSGFDLPLKAMRAQIASAVDLIVQATRLQGGPRKVTHITEVVGMEQDTIVMQDIYHYEKDGIDENGRAFGKFVATGIRPTFMDRLESAGVRLPASAFRQRVMLED